MRPAPELARLRDRQYHLQEMDLPAGSFGYLDDWRGDTLEIHAQVAAGAAGVVGLVVRAAPDQAEQTRIFYDWAAQRLVVDSTRASLDAAAPGSVQSGPLALAPGEPLRLHIFLDCSVVEVFANERACLTSRIYPARPDSLGLALFAQDGSARLHALDIWHLNAIWPAAA
jgi:beta-fructofuranosidase